MRKKDVIYIVPAFFVILAISGCGTVPKKFREEVSGIKGRVETLESRVEGVETKQAQVEQAANEQAQALEEMRTRREARTNISIKARPGRSREEIKKIQTCLRNAGFYTGQIDGIKGRKTRKAIREFQEANGLTPDGIVGKKTWELLNKYSSGGVQSAGSAEEGSK